ncbi:MAG: tetratricopeptide repeat protein [Desulfatitalea sp.]|nr:tetratricopeptide repeat protein [Desulfatitalea sp.]
MTKGITEPRVAIRAALVVSILIAAFGAWRCLMAVDSCSLAGLLLTADQQGQRLYRQGAYVAAAQRFMNPDRRAAALFRAGEFKAAAGLYAGMVTAEAAFNHGNALVMGGQYELAVEAYDRALSLRPDWDPAVTNRRIAAERAERLKQEGGDMTGGMLGADEIRFTDQKNSTHQTETVADAGAQNPADMRAIWLRQVRTKPADFLRAKFAYQQAMKGKKQ